MQGVVRDVPRGGAHDSGLLLRELQGQSVPDPKGESRPDEGRGKDGQGNCGRTRYGQGNREGMARQEEKEVTRLWKRWAAGSIHWVSRRNVTAGNCSRGYPERGPGVLGLSIILDLEGESE